MRNRRRLQQRPIHRLPEFLRAIKAPAFLAEPLQLLRLLTCSVDRQASSVHQRHNRAHSVNSSSKRQFSGKARRPQQVVHFSRNHRSRHRRQLRNQRVSLGLLKLRLPSRQVSSALDKRSHLKPRKAVQFSVDKQVSDPTRTKAAFSVETQQSPLRHLSDHRASSVVARRSQTTRSAELDNLDLLPPPLQLSLPSVKRPLSALIQLSVAAQLSEVPNRTFSVNKQRRDSRTVSLSSWDRNKVAVICSEHYRKTLNSNSSNNKLHRRRLDSREALSAVGDKKLMMVNCVKV